ncbi:MAG: 3'(2'),5'-bisphosphate nucleotidase CysQ [Rikenellaceae bacterium]
MKRELQIAIQSAILAGEKILEIYDDPQSDFGIERKADNSPLTKADKAAHIQIVELLDQLQIPVLSEEGRSIPYAERKGWNRLWIVDPLDGTKEFIKRNGEFTVNIALVEGGEPTLGVIYIPVTRELYYADREEGAFKVADIKVDELVCDIEKRAVKLPLKREHDSYRVVASRSHLSQQTSDFIESIRFEHPNIELVSKGSSLKICLVAEGSAEVYPRYAPTMEWDTAAGDAILRATGKVLVRAEDGENLEYNKEDLLNPYFVTKETI